MFVWGLTTRALGVIPTVTVVVEFVGPSITVMLLALLRLLPTYTLLVIGLTATAEGEGPAVTVVVEFVSPSITVTLLSQLFAT